MYVSFSLIPLAITVVGKELHQLSYAQLAGFRLHPGPLPEQYRISMQVQTKKKSSKKKKHKHRGNETPAHDDSIRGVSSASVGGGSVGSGADEDRDKRREKKHKKHDKDAEERRKRKKEKKRKRNKEDKE